MLQLKNIRKSYDSKVILANRMTAKSFSTVFRWILMTAK